MNINERIRDLRKSLKLSQEEFGNRLGVTKASISRLESGINNVTEQMIKSVCREYNVNYAWLKEGVGEMFISSDDSSCKPDRRSTGRGKRNGRKPFSEPSPRWMIQIGRTIKKIIDELKKD